MATDNQNGNDGMTSDLDEMWKDAEKEFRKMADTRDDKQDKKSGEHRLRLFKYTKKEGSDNGARELMPTVTHGEPLTPDQVIANLEAPVGVSREDIGKWKKTKTFAKNILGCVRQLGGLAAKGASTVFEPSELCYSAFCYLLETTQKYHEYFAGLADLFEHITPFLYRFQIHAMSKRSETGIEPGLKKIIQELLNIFVWICCHATSLATSGTRNKIKVFFGIALFRSDGGTSQCLDRIEELTRNELGLEVTMILQSVENTEDGLKDVLEMLKDFAEENKEKKTSELNQEIIKTVLEIDEKAQVALSDLQREYGRANFSSMGDWLIKDESFTAWSNAQMNLDNPVLALQAPPLHGKTYLCAQAVKRLQFSLNVGRDHKNSSNKALMGYFYFNSKAKDDDKKTKMIEALTSIIWQLTKNNCLYQKHVASKCRQQGCDFTKPVNLWKDCVMSYQNKKGAILYIVLDGIDQATRDDEFLGTAINDIYSLTSEPTQIRVLITGTEEVLTEIKKKSDRNFPTLHVEQRNENDIRLFVELKVEKLYKMWGRREVTDSLRRNIVDTMSKRKVDYKILSEILDQIGRAETAEDISKVIHDPNQNQKSTTKDLIGTLEQTLDKSSIDELNEMIPWMLIPPTRWPTVEEIEAILLIRRDGILSMMSLEKRIKERYHKILQWQDSFISCSAPTQLETYFMEEIVIDRSLNDSDATINNSITVQGTLRTADIHPSEITIVKNLLLSVCGDGLYKKFEFEEFFGAKQKPQRHSIRFNTIDGHIRIILCCLKALCGKHKKATNALHGYAFESLPWHLNEIKTKDFHRVDINSKRIIGRLLYKLLTDESCLEIWLNPKKSSAALDWLYHKTLLADLVRWFKETFVMEDAPNYEAKCWIILALNEQNQNDWFLPSARFMAGKWLRDISWDASEVARWISGFVTKKPEIIAGDPINYDIVKSSKLSVGNILTAETWAAKQLVSSDGPHQDPRWNTRLAETFLEFGHLEESRSRCIQALKGTGSLYWRASWCLAKVQWRKEDRGGACQTLQELLNLTKERKLHCDPVETTWKEVFHALADWSECSGNLKVVEEALSTLLQYFPSDYEAMEKTIRVMKKRNDYDALVIFLRNLQNMSPSRVEVEEPNLLCLLFFHRAESSDFHRCITFATGKDEGFKLVKNGYEAAVKHSKMDLKRRATLRYYHGLALFYQGGNKEGDISAATSLWKQNINDIKDHDYNAKQIRDKSARRFTAACLRISKDSNWMDSNPMMMLKSLRNKRPNAFGKHEDFLLGHLYEGFSQPDEVKVCLQSHIQEAMELLNDDDPENDWQGYFNLAEVLSHFDEKNALVAWSLITPKKDGESLRGLVGPIRNFCHGKCGHMWTFADDIYYCKECADVQFEEKCYEKLINRQLETRICMFNHEFLHVPKWDTNSESASSKEYVRVDDNYIKIKDWLRSIEVKWLGT